MLLKKTMQPLLLAGMTALAACDDTTPAPLEPNGPAGMSAAPQSIRGEEAELFDLAQKIPGFGGYFFDANGDAVVYLQDPSRRTAAVTALEPILRRPRGRRAKANPDVIVRQGQYAFMQIAAWRDQAVDEVLNISGSVWVDADEMQNRLAIGVADARARVAVERRLAELGIPGGAVTISESDTAMVEPVMSVESEASLSVPGTLRDQNGPIRGGMMLIYRNWGDGKLKACTVAFATVYEGSPAGVSNSHCSTTEWKLESTRYYFGEWIGYEWKDPSSNDNCGPFWAYKCRNADAMIFGAYPRATMRGYIARPLLWHTDNDTMPKWRDIDPERPTLQITGIGTIAGGQEVDKIGQKTGWTYGNVARTCTATNGENWHRYYCQNWTYYASDYGDSGSPVFKWHGDTVELLGVHWGRTKHDGTWYKVYSPYDRVTKDLGSLPVTP